MLTSVLLALRLVSPSDSVLLRVLTINDFHGSLQPRTYPWSNGRPIGGIAALKGLMDELEAECGCPTLRLDAGDQMQGSLPSNLVFGRSAVEAMALLGLDAAAIGNHDLDWGRDTLQIRMREAPYPWLAANIFDSTSGKRPDWARPWAMIKKGPYRIAVIGYITPQTKTIVMDRHVRGLDFRRGQAAISDVVAEAKAADPDFTVLVAHEGARCDSLACVGAILQLSRQFDSLTFDVIAAGHTHTLVNTTDRGTAIVSAGSNGTNVGVVDLVRNADGSTRWAIRVETVFADGVRLDSAGVALVDRYRPLVDSISNRLVVELADSLVGGRGEFPLGNLIADAQRAAARADVGLMNNGGIRRALLPGPVSYADLFELQPFSNVVVSVSVTGNQLKAVLEHAVDGGTPDYHISGITVRYNPRGRPGARILEIRKTGGARITRGGRYRLALSDFLAGGGGGLTMVRQLQQRSTGLTDLEALIMWLQSRPAPVRAPSGRRWKAVPQ